MRYLLLLYGDPQAEDALGEEGRRRIVDEHGRFTQRLRERGAYVHGDPLAGGSAAKIVRRDGERPIVTDGPFAETKEQLGGFYVIEADGTEEALEWAKQVPLSPGLVVDLRPIPAMD